MLRAPNMSCLLVATRVLMPLALAALAACSGANVDPRPDVILISIDTLRPDHLGAYGYAKPTSPTLDAIAEQGVVFEDVTSPSPWTLPAHASLLTGLYPSRHRANSHYRSLGKSAPTLASILSEHGYDAAAVVNSHNLSRRYGLDRGFRRFRHVQEWVFEVMPTTEVTDQAVEWLSAPRRRPLFLFLHYYDVHSDYRSLPDFESAFLDDYDGHADGTTRQLAEVRKGNVSFDEDDVAHLLDLYDAGILQIDHELGRLLTLLRARGLLDRSLLVITSDHGEEFLEHGGVLHGRTQFQEVLRVPLLMRGPGLPAGTRVSTPVSLVDIAPTLLAMLEIPAPASLDGVDLAPLWRGETRDFAERHLFGEADHHNEVDDITRSVRQGRYALHYNRLTEQHQLYDLEQDPWERVDIAAEQQEIADRLRERLLRFMADAEQAALAEDRPLDPLTPEELQHLRELGYLQ